MIAVAVKDYLEAEGVGTFGQNLFVGTMPDSPDNLICLNGEPGPVLPEMHSYDADGQGVQIRTRGGYVWSAAKIWEIHRRITGLTGIYNQVRIIDTKIQTAPAELGDDSDGRMIWTAHYDFYTNIGNNKYRTGTYNP